MVWNHQLRETILREYLRLGCDALETWTQTKSDSHLLVENEYSDLWVRNIQYSDASERRRVEKEVRIIDHDRKRLQWRGITLRPWI